MKPIFLVSLVLCSCASWKQKDFKKELEKSKAQEVRVEVSDELREKFEIQLSEKLPEKKIEKPITKIQVTKNKIQKPSRTKEKVQKGIEEKSKASPTVASGPLYPKDYPEDLKEINAKAKKTWDEFKPRFQLNQKTFLDIHYLGMTVGKIMFTNLGKRMINNKEVWHFHARFKSAPFYSKIYELNDSVDTYVTTDQFLSARYSLVQRESKMDIDDLQLNDREKLKSFWFYKQKKSNGSVKNKNKESFIPFYSIDPFSVLFFLQGLPLRNGDYFEIPLINKAKVKILKANVETRETIETNKGKIRAIRVHAVTKFQGDHLKDGDILLWFADDDQRTLLKIKAKIKIGSITADIVEG